MSRLLLVLFTVVFITSVNTVNVAVNQSDYSKNGIFVEGQTQPIKLVTNIKAITKKKNIAPRKGVKPEDFNSTLSFNGSTSEATLINDKQQSLNATIPPSTTGDKRKVIPVHEEAVGSSSTTKKPGRKPRPKPHVTKAGKEADDPIPALPTNNSPLGMPRKIDYIVPGVITVTALPLMGFAFFILYKRGRDFWDKRHYRRMDFLIDGMYNE